MEDSSGSEKFPCVLCNEVFNSKPDLQQHFRDHASKKGRKAANVTCDVCSEEFANNTAAIQHKFRKHPNNRDTYNCPTCGIRFTIKGIYDKHIASHDDGVPKSLKTKCDTCGARFHNLKARDYHVKATHDRVIKLNRPIQTAPPSKKIKVNNAGEVSSVYYCHLCGTEYIVKFNLQKHLEQCHTEEQRSAVPENLIRCTVCDAFFCNTKAYENHNIGHKPDDLYVTDEQMRLRTVTRIDQDFDASRVQSLADKYLQPSNNRGRRKTASNVVKKKKEEELEEMSPPSSPDASSDSDSADDTQPLSQLTKVIDN